MALRDFQVERDEKKCDNDSTNLSKRRHLLTFSIDHCLHHSADVEFLIPRIYLVHAHLTRSCRSKKEKRKQQKSFEIFLGDKITGSLSISFVWGIHSLVGLYILMNWTVNLKIPQQSQSCSFHAAANEPRKNLTCECDASRWKLSGCNVWTKFR